MRLSTGLVKLCITSARDPTRSVIDARPPTEWRRVHLAGAVSILYSDRKRLDEV
jgi:rhodanese-related sulfurtransferase